MTRHLPHVRHVLVGRAQPFGPAGAPSGIAKRPVPHAVAVGPLGLEGDQQGDLRIHGGPDKAVHLYAWAHHASWRRELPGLALLDAPGAFGENLSLAGLDESGVCIGDRWRVGSAVLEVSQGRQPCWKLNQRFGVPDVAARVQHTLRAGWYCRVLQPGSVAAGDTLERLDCPHPDWTVARLLALIRDRECRPAAIEAVLALPLTPSWRALFQRRLEQGRVESWAGRMDGPG